jgi:hypothetical protein
MSTILAAIDATAPARPVLETGVVLGRRLRLPVIGFHLCQDDVEPVRLLAAWAAVELLLAVGVPAQAIVGALGGADVAMVVLGVRGHPAGPRPAGSTALAVADHAIKPVVVGATGTARSTTGRPASGPGAAGRHPDAARAVDQAVRWFAGWGVGIVSLHVFVPPPCRASGTGPSMTTPPGRGSSWPATPWRPVGAWRSAADGRPTRSWRWPAPNGPT